MDDGIRYVHDKVMPAVQQMDGCVGISMLADRETGRCIITTAWADVEAMRNSAEGVRSIRDRAGEILGGQPEVNEWEIAVLHRMHETHDGACARVIWAEGDPGQLDRMLDTFRTGLIPRMEDLPGFCSVSMMVDRQSGRTATAVTYDSRESMDRAQEQGRAMRDEFSMQMNSRITEVAAFDMVLAHLRVPETV
jgi:quinol monooxygenase YgiN